jgi:hypothetical protein
MRPLTRLLPLALAAWLMSPAQASAKFFLITHGNTMKEYGPIVNPQKKAEYQQRYGQDVKVGFYNDYFGIFWIDFWTWGGTFCVYTEKGDQKQYDPVSADEAAALLGKSPGELSRPCLYKYPLGLVILGGLAALFVPLGILGMIVEKKELRLFDDPAYARAVGILRDRKAARRGTKARRKAAAGEVSLHRQESPPEPEDSGSPEEDFREAVRFLVREGVPREEAEKNLQMMLDKLNDEEKREALLNRLDAARRGE